MGLPGALRSEDIDPDLTDEEIIKTFTPLEHKFHKWYTSREYHANEDRWDDLHGVLEKQYPGETEILDKWRDYCVKWLQRGRRRREYRMSSDQFLQFIRSTPCKNAAKLANCLWVYLMHNTPDLFIGQSVFGGALAGYAIVTCPHILYPDIPTSKMSNPSNPDLLDRVVLAVDATGIPSHGDTQAPPSPGKHRRQNRTSSSSGDYLGISGGSSSSRDSVRSATSNDFIKNTPFCFLQIGILAICKEPDWHNVRDNFNVLADAQWENTGYGVVVRLNGAGHPTGEVFVIFNYWRTRDEADSGPLAEEIEWKDHRNVELPHIRSLYDGCTSRFFMAKIADKLDDLKEDILFDFNIIFEHRIDLTMAKKVSTKVQGSGDSPEVIIIPNDIRVL